MAWVLILVYLLLSAPVRAGALLRLEAGRAEGRLGVMVWGFRRTADLKLQRNGEDRAELRLLHGGRETILPFPRKKPDFWKKNRPSPGARFLAGRALSLLSFSADIRIGGEDAARTALLSGLAQIIGALLPRARLRCRPRYNGKTSVSLFCIGQARLGTIIALCLRGFMKDRLAGRKKEEKAWTVPSGT